MTSLLHPLFGDYFRMYVRLVSSKHPPSEPVKPTVKRRERLPYAVGAGVAHGVFGLRFLTEIPAKADANPCHPVELFATDNTVHTHRWEAG
jgi:hypothetical protein